MKFLHKLSRNRAAYLAVALFLLSANASAQVSASPQRFSPLAKGYFERAASMLDAGNYTGVIDQLKHLDTQNVTLEESEQEEYLYLLAEALYERGDEECIELLRDFEREFPASPLALKAKLSIADFYFFKHQYSEALTEYENVDYDRLTGDDFNLYSYRKALSLIKTGRASEARGLMNMLSANDSKYRDASNFYVAYIDYVEGDLDSAYSRFSKVTSSEKGLEAGYYMTQIEYTRGEYENVISHGRSLLQKNPVEELVPETNRIVGLSYFKEGEYSVAQSFLNNYLEGIGDSTPNADAIYALGVIDYDNADYETASERFSTLTDLDNDIAQSAWLYLGQCNLKTGNTDTAAIAFEKAAKMDYDTNVSETALYNYVTAITRGGKIPFSSSVDLLEKFISTYPDSEYTPKVEEYLASAYYNDKNYSKALTKIEAIKNPSKKVLAAKQKVLYELGIESVTNGNNKEAVSYLTRSIELSSYDKQIAAQSQLWLGDAQYAQGNYSSAQKAYQSAANSMTASSNRSLALYNLAYSDYMQGNYATAKSDFDKALAASPALPSSLKADATIRRADCLYYTGDYSSAKAGYAEAISAKATDADYAAYRHAVMRGLGGDTSGKISELNAIETNYPGSQWIPTAMLEKALTYEGLGQSANAVKAYKELASKYPDASQARKALLNLAMANAKAGNYDDAVENYKEVITRWPSSEEASMANDDLKKYYSSTGKLSEYVAFLKTVPGATQLDADELEQLTFDGAETAYAEDITSISLLKEYVSEYPDGKYLAPALLDIATSLRESGKYEEAEEALTQLIATRPHSAQYPEALLMKAEILENNISGRTADALTAYKELERNGGSDFIADAYAGIMRTTTDSQECITYARKAKQSGGLSADKVEEASLYEAEALLKTGNTTDAETLLAELAQNPASLSGAKAAVTLAQHYLDLGNYTKAEAVALEFTDAGTSHQYWLAKGFIALADAYHGQGKTYLAKEYLQSLRDNYPGKESDIATAISTRLKSWK